MSRIAVLGCGVVGSGVCRLLTEHAASIARQAGEPVELKYVLDVRDLSAGPYGDCAVSDFSVIERDPEIDIVVEAIGGVAAAGEYTERALRAGKSVVTPNKALVAERGSDLIRLAGKNGVSYLFEGSVGGGIPILHPLARCLAGNHVEEVGGILNGTTNYILTRMIQAGIPFDEALKEAQSKGYAEADPSADISGMDTCRKLCILSAMAFGKRVRPDQIPTEGVTGVTLADVAYAADAGMQIKFLGRAVQLPDGAVCAFVAPQLVRNSSPLAWIEDVFNAVSVRGDAVGPLLFCGQGAGQMATASAVIGDIAEIIRSGTREAGACWTLGEEPMQLSPDALQWVWYVRLSGSRSMVEERFGRLEMLHREYARTDELAFLTPSLKRSELDRRLNGLNVHSVFRVW